MSTESTNTLAIVSCVMSLAGCSVLPLLASFVAIVTGHMARSQIRRSGEDGDVLAIIGLVVGYGMVLVSCLGTAMAVLLYGGLFAFLTAAGVAAQ